MIRPRGTAAPQPLHDVPAVVLLLIAVLLTGGCATEPSESPARGDWDGSISTAGTVATVVNRSGSVWGDVELVEEASIGVLDGADEYVFSQVRAVTASDDRIFVLDGREGIIRVYDMAGGHLFDIGRQGDGPGEFRRPWAIGLSLEPRLLVRDLAQSRVHEFSLDGELLDDWRAEGGGPTTIADEGFVYVYRRLPADTADAPVRFGMSPTGPEGAAEMIPIPIPTFEQQRMLVPMNRRFIEVGMMESINQGLRFSVADVPFAPNPQWALAGDGTLIWGESDTYRFALERRDGSVVHVERAEDPVPIGGDERRWYRDRLTRFWREVMPEFRWTEGVIPATKRAFVALTPDGDRRVWVLRELAGVPLADCDPDPDDFSSFVTRPCWRQPLALDGFGGDGRFLGRILVPEGTRFDVPPFMDGDTMITVVEDEAGAIMVKRYRIDRDE